MSSIVDGFKQISSALSGPGPQTDHSNHTTVQLPPHPVEHGAVHTNQKTPDTGNFDMLRAGKYAQMARMGLNPDGSPMKKGK